jgi:hypothetical protein
VSAPLHEVEAAWKRFTEQVLTGRRKLVCDELRCIDAVARGAVAFERVDGGATRVLFRASVADDLCDERRVAEERELLDAKVAHDLVVFWDYIESGEYRGEQTRREIARARHEDELRRTHQSRRKEGISDQEALSLRRGARS